MVAKKKVGMIVSLLLVGGALGYLALGNFGENVVYFFTPSEVKAFSTDYYQKKVRVGGLIMAKHSEDYMPIELKRAGVELPRKDFMKSLVE